MIGLDDNETADQQYQNTLVIAPLDTACFKRTFVYKNGYQYPITISLHGFDGELLGVSAKIYDPSQPQSDSNGIFMIPMNNFESKIVETARGKKKRTNFNLEDYSKRYGIISILNSHGFDQLLTHLVSTTGTPDKQSALQPHDNQVPTIHQRPLTKTYSTKFCALEEYLRLA